MSQGRSSGRAASGDARGHPIPHHSAPTAQNPRWEVSEHEEASCVGGRGTGVMFPFQGSRRERGRLLDSLFVIELIF